MINFKPHTIFPVRIWPLHHKQFNIRNEYAENIPVVQVQRNGKSSKIESSKNNTMSKIKRFDYSFLSKDEEIIFYAILLINIVFLFPTRFYPSMDGPAHLYNSNLIKQLVLSNHFIGDFFQINSFPVPNWTSHFILSFFGLFLPAWLSEKFLLILYVSGMAISFRLLIKTLKRIHPTNSIFSIRNDATTFA